MIVEKKASGQSLIQDLRRAGLPIMEYNPDRDKVSRVNAITPLMESGRVWIPSDRQWADDLLNQALRFPGGKHDDMVDAMAMAILYVKDSWRVEHPDDPEWEDEAPRRRRGGYWVLP
jgi:predicted phage terminase large subunit-like protein